MAFSHGKLANIKVDDSGGSLTDISSYTNETTWPQELDASEVTTFGNGNKAYIPGLADSTVSMSGSYDPTVDALFNGVRAAMIAGTVASSSLAYSPYGTTGGNVKYTAEAILTSYEISSKVGDPNEWKAEYQVTGAITKTTN